MKTIKLFALITFLALLGLSCETSDISEEQNLFEDQESVDLRKIKKRT